MCQAVCEARPTSCEICCSRTTHRCARCSATFATRDFDPCRWSPVKSHDVFEPPLALVSQKGLDAVVPAKDFKRRMVVEIEGAPHMIEQIQVQTPSARGAATLYKIKARNLKTKNRIEKTYRGTDSLSESSFERRPVQFLYRDPEAFHFMDSESFNQFSFTLEDLGEQASFMTENMADIEALVVDDEVIAIELPDTVDLPIAETAPGVRGNSATGRTKPATLSTGFIVQVPEHLEPGTLVRVDTRTGEYLGRANS